MCLAISLGLCTTWVAAFWGTARLSPSKGLRRTGPLRSLASYTCLAEAQSVPMVDTFKTLRRVLSHVVGTSLLSLKSPNRALSPFSASASASPVWLPRVGASSNRQRLTTAPLKQRGFLFVRSTALEANFVTPLTGSLWPTTGVQGRARELTSGSSTGLAKVSCRPGPRVGAAGHQVTFEPGQTGRSRTASFAPPATHRASGTRRINQRPPSPRWATNVTDWPAATKLATRLSNCASGNP